MALSYKGETNMGNCPDALYQALLTDLSSQNSSDPSARSVAICLLREKFLSKWESSNELADSLAISKFRRFNKSCKVWKLSCDSMVDEAIDNHMRFYLSKFEGTLPSDLSYYDYGPGASAGVKGTSFYHKMIGKCSMTRRSIYSVYIKTIRSSPVWVESEKERTIDSRNFIVEPSSKLCVVPKNEKCSRAICVEPSLNMFLQKGLGAYLERLLIDQYSIDIYDQQVRNRKLAREGSISGIYSTIDLEGASDSISISFCREFLPPLLFETLMFLRSPTTKIGDEIVELNMIGSMGNATTFPLQTIIFSSLLKSVYAVMGVPFCPRDNRGSSIGNYGTFGDDIICVAKCYDVVRKTLIRYGFTPNEDKCFTGYNPFRESCGGDYHRGRNVRPVYCKRLKTAQDRASLLNRLVAWGARHSVPLSNTIRYLSVGLPIVPLWSPESSGVRASHSAPIFRKGTVHYVYKSLSTKEEKLSVEQKDRDLKDFKKRFFKKMSSRYSENVLYLSFLQGSVRNSKILPLFGRTYSTQRELYTSVWYATDRSSSFLEDISDEGYTLYITGNVDPILKMTA